MLLHESSAPRGVLEECMQAVQQTRPRGRELRWRVPREVRKRVKRIDGVPEVREEEGRPMVAGAATDLGYERVARRTGVELGDKIDRRRQAPRQALRGEVVVAQILIDVPRPASLSLSRGCQELRAAVFEAEYREPSFCDEAIDLRDGRGVTFEHQRAAGSVADPHPIHRLLQPLKADRPVPALRAAEHLLQPLVDLRCAGFPSLLQRAYKSDRKSV